jgi:catechol 2,3-dioxygenase
MPPNALGLRHWTIELESAGEVAEVAARLADAGVAADPVGGGVQTADPWGIGLRIVSAN